LTVQQDFRMPATGEAWRHYKSGLYTIIGMARDDEGHAVVVYTDYTWGNAQLAPIYTQRLIRFVQEVANGVPRFKYERSPSGLSPCQYINSSAGVLR